MTERRFKDWSRVRLTDPSGDLGVVVWDPSQSKYAVLWDGGEWDYYESDTTDIEEYK